MGAEESRYQHDQPRELRSQSVPMPQKIERAWKRNRALRFINRIGDNLHKGNRGGKAYYEERTEQPDLQKPRLPEGRAKPKRAKPNGIRPEGHRTIETP